MRSGGRDSTDPTSQYRDVGFRVASVPAPGTPTGLTAMSGTGIGQILLNWRSSTGVQNYLLQRSTTSVNGYSALATVSSGTTFIDNNPLLAAGQTYYYEIAAANVSGTSTFSAPASAMPYVPATYGGWAYSFFGLNAPLSVAGDTATPANDGVTNLMKYAMGLNPNTTTGGGLPACGTTSASGTNYLELSFTRNTAAADIIFTVQGSSDLSGSNWSTISTFSSGAWSPSDNVTETSGTATVRDTMPMSSAPRRFLRLEITH